jgi:hypothetical protein
LSSYNQVLSYDGNGNIATIVVSSPAITKTYTYSGMYLQNITFSGAGIASLTNKTKTFGWTGDIITGITYSA